MATTGAGRATTLPRPPGQVPAAHRPGAAAVRVAAPALVAVSVLALAPLLAAGAAPAAATAGAAVLPVAPEATIAAVTAPTSPTAPNASAALAAALTPGGPPASGAQARSGLDALVQRVHQTSCRQGLDSLASLAAGHDLEARRASFLLGRCLARANLHARAADAFRKAAWHPSLRAHARLELGTALMRSDQAAESAAALRELAAAASGRLRGRAFLALGEAELTLDRHPESVAALAAAVERRPDDPAAWLLLGRAAAAAGQRDRALWALRRAAWAFPGDPIEGRARSVLAALLGRPVQATDMDTEARLLRGKRLAAQGEWDQAEVELRAAAVLAGDAAREAQAPVGRAGTPGHGAQAPVGLAGGPGYGPLTPPGRVAGEAWYRLGEIYMGTDLRAAHAAFRRAAERGWNPAAAWFLAYAAARRAGMSAQAREASDALLRTAPAGTWAGRYWLGAGLRAEASGRREEAEASYRRVIAAAPAGGEAAEARWRLGWMALTARRTSGASGARGAGEAGGAGEAAARFRDAAGGAPDAGEAARAWYWAAKALEAPEAGPILRMVAEKYPLTFYGQRARSRLGLPPPALSPSPPQILRPEAPSPAHEELARLGLDAEAAEAAEDALTRGGDPRVSRFLALAYNRLGEFTRSVGYAERALALGIRDADTWRLAYPKAYWPEVGAAARAAGIDPLLLLAMVREESRYDASVISPARAVGLAQLLPTTAQALSRDPSMTARRLMDPATNLTLGARYLRRQLDRFGGDLRLALAAYNAGPGAARRWVRLDADPDYFIEKIGYAETRAYLRRVLGSYGVYRLLW
jgi:soluble lytic murein transglycosylase-like protein